MKQKAERDLVLFVEDILDSIEKIEFVLGQIKEEDFFSNWQQQDILARRIEIIGEAAKKVPVELRKNTLISHLKT